METLFRFKYLERNGNHSYLVSALDCTGARVRKGTRDRFGWAIPIPIYRIDDSKLHFALQIFTDMDQGKEEKFWREFLKVNAKQFYKTINTRSGSIGTYREKSKHGVRTIYFNNKKLRDVFVGEIEKMKEVGYYAQVR